jgi:hypothetical protein
MLAIGAGAEEFRTSEPEMTVLASDKLRAYPDF